MRIVCYENGGCVDEGTLDVEYKLSKKFVCNWLKKSDGAMFFGVPIVELSKDELIALAVCMAHKEQSVRKEMSELRDSAFSEMASLHKQMSKKRLVWPWSKT